MKQYKNRIFLVINCMVVPPKTAKTNVKGWMDKDGIQIAEAISFHNGLSDKLILKSSVVIDVEKKTCIKSGLTDYMRTVDDALPSDDEVASHYLKKYEAHVNKTLQQYTLMA
jgi:hypothetical protein